MKRHDGLVVLKAALDASAILQKSIDGIEGSLEPNEAHEYKLSVGRVLAFIGDEMIEKTFMQLPELRPEDTSEAWRALRDEVGTVT